MLCNGAEDSLEDQFQPLRLGSQGHVKTARGARDGLQALFVEPRPDECAGLVLHKSAALPRRYRDQVTGRCPNADGVDLNAVRFCRRLCCLEGTALQIFTISHQDQYSIATGASAQSGLRSLDGSRYI